MGIMMPNGPYHTPGLIFRRLDLHLHTPASRCFDDPTATADMIVEEALRKGLAGIAVTDHNSATLVDTVKEAARGRDLVVFPGAEITCMGGKEGIHIIALFDPSAGRAEVEGLLAELGLQPSDYGLISTLVKKDPLTVVEVINRRGGLAILAHANSTRGALNDMSGQQRTDLIRFPLLRAAEATDFQNEDLKKRRRRVIDLLDGNDPTYRRRLAVYQASDNPSGRDDGKHALVGIGTRTAYFKLDKINLEGLRQCLADPDVRIRQDFEYAAGSYPRIKRVSVTGGFLNEGRVEFHDGLNSILGAKGAGKSLLIEFMRFVLDQPPQDDELLRDHEAKLEQRLEDYGTVECVLVDETGKEFTLKRVYNPAEESPYEEGEHRQLAQFFPVLFLSQNEIIRVAEDPDQQIRFIDGFFDFRSYRARIESFENSLAELDRQLAESMRAFQQVKGLEKQMRTIEAELPKLDAALKNPVFDEYSLLEAKDRSFREHIQAISTIHERVSQTHKSLLSPGPPIIPEPLKADPPLRRSQDRVTQGRDLVQRRLYELRDELRGLGQQVDQDYQRWLPDYQAGKKRYEQAIQDSGGDYKVLAQRRAKQVKELEVLTAGHRTVKETADRLRDIGTARRDLLHEVRQAYEGYTAERKARCETIEKESGDRLRLRIQESSNVDEFRRRLSELKRGSYLRDSDIESICTKVDSGDFMRAVIQFSLSGNMTQINAVAAKAGIDGERMRTLAEFLLNEYSFEQLLSLEYKALPKDRPEIAYNVGNGRYEILEKLSVGQKCTAMLVVALSEGKMPIVIDQPEDSLDIRSIWEDICLKVRRGKEKRQFLFTTHNSSVAVAADTDKFVIIEGDATRGRIVSTGSMDHAPISGEALKYLEGGAATYRAKFEKYRGEDLLKPP